MFNCLRQHIECKYTFLAMLESYIAAMKLTHFLLVYIQEDKRQLKDLMNAEEDLQALLVRPTQEVNS